MLFGKKKQDDKPLPIDEVKKMASRGMSDKDIIKELKHRGFDLPATSRMGLRP